MWLKWNNDIFLWWHQFVMCCPWHSELMANTRLKTKISHVLSCHEINCNNIKSVTVISCQWLRVELNSEVFHSYLSDERTGCFTNTKPVFVWGNNPKVEEQVATMVRIDPKQIYLPNYIKSIHFRHGRATCPLIGRLMAMTTCQSVLGREEKAQIAPKGRQYVSGCVKAEKRNTVGCFS